MKTTPVLLLTGFLGSGKTTLLSRLLGDAQFRDTAVIVNEFGAVSLDHEMIRSADESIITLGNGCLCCRSSSDIARALNELRQRRADGEISFSRVIIETSGLADPVPLLQALGSDLVIAMSFELAGVVTVVDAVAGLSTLAQYPEAQRQVALADRLLISKTDLNPDCSALQTQLALLNRGAPQMPASQWQGDIERAGLPQTILDAALQPQVRHAQFYCTISLVRDAPLPAAVVPLLLEGLATHLGERLLRMKGLLSLAESPQQPMVVHSVQHMVYAPQWLDAWPSADRRSRLVLIGHDLPAAWPSLLLDMLEAEVAALTPERACAVQS